MTETPSRQQQPEAKRSERPSQFAECLRSGGFTAAVELRPPRSGLTRSGATEMWIDLSHTAQGLAARDVFLFLTDNAVGEEEEDNLQHLTANLATEIDPRRVVPFLTCLHPLDYCLRYSDRARARGVESLTVTGGDTSSRVQRCVPHGYALRRELRTRAGELALGGWVNLHRPLSEQIGYATDPRYEADYYLTQVVSHHDLPLVERWLEAAEERDLRLPGSFGVFYYRSGNRETLNRLSTFFPVPVEAVGAAFDAGVTPERHCAQTIVALQKLGVDNFYLCNLGARHAATLFDRIMAEVAALGGKSTA